VAKRKNLPQLDGCLSPVESTLDSTANSTLDSTPQPSATICSTTTAPTSPPGYITCRHCKKNLHDPAFFWCVTCNNSPWI
jgi:hypothetical protein